MWSELSFATNELGEKNFEHYYGPFNPIVSKDKNYIFQDDYNEDLYINSRIDLEIFGLDEFIRDELQTGVSCPNEVYTENKEYISYLNNLITLSYLFELFREYEKWAPIFADKTCSFNWNKQLSKCAPESKDMKLFLLNSKEHIAQLPPVIRPFSITNKDGIKKWKDELSSNSGGLLQERIKLECKNGKCKNTSNENIAKLLQQSCDNDMRLFLKVCSEEAELGGISYIPEVYRLLVSSNAMRAIKKDNISYGAGCVQRYIKEFKGEEKKDSRLRMIFSYLYQSLQSNSNVQYAQGRLFPLGALREFQEKGLANLYTPKKVVTKKEIQVIQPAVVAKVAPAIIAKPIIKKTVKKKEKKAVVKLVPEKKKIEYSAFKIASDFRESYDLNQVEVDMLKFSYSYIFTPKQIETLQVQMKSFSAQKSLEEMKKFDKLGTKKSPLPLKFIKFLIDREMHQGLYNIINVISSKFYVFNDIDPVKNKKDLIEIKNDKTTNFQWKIFILKSE